MKTQRRGSLTALMPQRASTPVASAAHDPPRSDATATHNRAADEAGKTKALELFVEVAKVPEKDDRKKLHFKVSRAIHKQLKMIALDREWSLERLTDAIMSCYLRNPEKFDLTAAVPLASVTYDGKQ